MMENVLKMGITAVLLSRRLAAKGYKSGRLLFFCAYRGRMGTGSAGACPHPFNFKML
jgi:hypothetical protein